MQIKYTLKNLETNEVTTETLTLQQVENGEMSWIYLPNQIIKVINREIV